jgi:hypothetical protein
MSRHAITSEQLAVRGQGGQHLLAFSWPSPLPQPPPLRRRRRNGRTPAAFEAPLPLPRGLATQTPRPDRVWPNAHLPRSAQRAAQEQEATAPVTQSTDTKRVADGRPAAYGIYTWTAWPLLAPGPVVPCITHNLAHISQSDPISNQILLRQCESAETQPQSCQTPPRACGSPARSSHGSACGPAYPVTELHSRLLASVRSQLRVLQGGSDSVYVTGSPITGACGALVHIVHVCLSQVSAARASSSICRVSIPVAGRPGGSRTTRTHSSNTFFVIFSCTDSCNCPVSRRDTSTREYKPLPGAQGRWRSASHGLL